MGKTKNYLLGENTGIRIVSQVEERNGQERRDQSCDWIFDSGTATFSLILYVSGQIQGFSVKEFVSHHWELELKQTNKQNQYWSKNTPKKISKTNRKISTISPHLNYPPFHTHFSDEHIPLSSSLHYHTYSCGARIQDRQCRGGKRWWEEKVF